VRHGERVETVIVLAGGDPVTASMRSLLPASDLVVAADSGVHHAAMLQLHVDVIVGDFDSADAAIVDAAVADGAIVERHPAEKDATDLELALLAAAERGAQRVTVVGGAGGRLDHLLVNLAVLASPRFAHMEVSALMNEARVTVVQAGRPAVTLRGEPGALLTLVPLGGSAGGITTEGLQYPLHDEDLDAGTTRGVSNVFVSGSATVALREGTLLAVQPERGAR
jgi:thiamine pyrophosphokinase